MNTERNNGRQIELSVGRLDGLSILPCVAAGLFTKLLKAGSSQGEIAELIETDPILAARFFSMLHQQRISFADAGDSVRRALGQISAETVRDGFLSLKLYPGFEAENAASKFRKQMTLHSVATACCAREIAEIFTVEPETRTAYLAGLLHNIGNFAFDEAMPKSFARIVEQSKAEQTDIKALQKKYLGIDYTILGKRLGTRWHLPEEIVTAIWLHRSEAGQLAPSIAGIHLAQIVRLAEAIVRQCGIGDSGNYGPIEPVEPLTESLGIELEHIDRIRGGLADKVSQKAKLLNLDIADAASEFCGVIQDAAAQMAREQTRLAADNRKLQSDSSHYNFIMEFLSGIDANTSAAEIAESFAVRWQKFYQTGMVCLYITAQTEQETADAVFVETLAKSRVFPLMIPAGTAAVPKEITDRFAIIDAQDSDMEWLFEQLDSRFNIGQTKILPLLCGGKTVGVLLFELRYPGDPELFEAKFRASVTAAGTVLNMAEAAAQKESFSEDLVELLHKPAIVPQPEAAQEPKKAEPEAETEVYSIDTLAEMAAGAAHELNNPLSVISGRAQLLSDGETDADKQQMLRQIQDNSDEIAEIIDDLMAFAQPPMPRRTNTDIRQIVDEAVQLTLAKTDFDHINTEVQVGQGVGEVYADSAQIVSAMANILTNSLESYQYEIGGVKITAETDGQGDFVKIDIIDSGCGMSPETLSKATQPFFSSKNAGRKRGMGLAQAARLIKLNNGSLKIKSSPETGTTVSITLPCKE